MRQSSREKSLLTIFFRVGKLTPPCTWRRAIAAVTVALSILSASNAQAQTVPPLPMVEGPITGSGPMYPGLRLLAPGTEPADYGYLTEEFFVSGTANGLPYTTRMPVRRPAIGK